MVSRSLSFWQISNPYSLSLGLGYYSYKTGGLGNMSLTNLGFTLEARDGALRNPSKYLE